MSDFLEFSYDVASDILTVEGVEYSGALFRALGVRGLQQGWLRVEERRDGLLTVYQPTETEQRAIHAALKSTVDSADE